MRFRKLKNGASITLSGVDQITLWLMWIRGTMTHPRQSYKKSLLEPKTKEDMNREQRLREFQKRHHIRFYYKRGADIGEFNFRFTKGYLQS